jgi:hypothetical protein
MLTRAAGGAAAAVIRLVGALTAGYAVARAAWYPFWAAGASAEELHRSWGGPTAVGATLVHWVVAAALIATGWALLRLARRLRRGRRSLVA